MLMVRKSVLITGKHKKDGKSLLVFKELSPESKIEMDEMDEMFDEMDEMDEIDMKSIFDSLASKKKVDNSSIAKEFINEFYNR
jgi:hypothetical protein